MSKQIQGNITARQGAQAVFDLIKDETSQRYWECLVELCQSKLPPVSPPVDKYPAMTEKEAQAFEKELMPYGAHKDWPVGTVPVEYLIFLVEGDKFTALLKRYIKSKTFRERQ